jgi:ribosomal protein S30
VLPEYTTKEYIPRIQIKQEIQYNPRIHNKRNIFPEYTIKEKIYSQNIQ